MLVAPSGAAAGTRAVQGAETPFNALSRCGERTTHFRQARKTQYGVPSIECDVRRAKAAAGLLELCHLLREAGVRELPRPAKSSLTLEAPQFPLSAYDASTFLSCGRGDSVMQWPKASWGTAR